MKTDIFNSIRNKINQYRSPIDVDAEWAALSQRPELKEKDNRFLRLAMCLLLVFSAGAGIYLSGWNKSTNVNSLMESKDIVHEQVILKEESAEKCDPTFNLPLVNTALPSVNTGKNFDGAIFVPFEAKNSATTLAAAQPINEAEGKKSPSEITQVLNELAVNLNLHSEDRQVNQDGDKKTPSTNAIRQIAQLSPLPIAHLEAKSNSLDLISLSKNEKEPELMGDDNAQSKPSKVQVFLNAGIGYTGQQMSAKSGETSLYRDLRTASETALETYSVEMGVNTSISPKSSLRLAVNYQLGYDRVQHTYDVPKTYDFEDVLLARVTNLGTGDVTERFGDTTILGTSTLMNTQFNKYQTASISLAWGYKLLENDRFRLTLNMGTFHNFSLRAKGSVVSSDDPTGPLVPLSGYKKAYNLGLLTGFDFDYKLKNGISLSLRPTATYGLFSATENSRALTSTV